MIKTPTRTNGNRTSQTNQVRTRTSRTKGHGKSQTRTEGNGKTQTRTKGNEIIQAKIARSAIQTTVKLLKKPLVAKARSLPTQRKLQEISQDFKDFARSVTLNDIKTVIPSQVNVSNALTIGQIFGFEKVFRLVFGKFGAAALIVLAGLLYRNYREAKKKVNVKDKQ